jgi:hypothetical protein
MEIDFLCLLTAFQPFRFAERKSLRRLLMYTNPGLTDNDIPHKSTMAAVIDAKVEKLDAIDVNALKVSGFITTKWSLESYIF